MEPIIKVVIGGEDYLLDECMIEKDKALQIKVLRELEKRKPGCVAEGMEFLSNLSVMQIVAEYLRENYKLEDNGYVAECLSVYVESELGNVLRRGDVDE